MRKNPKMMVALAAAGVGMALLGVKSTDIAQFMRIAGAPELAQMTETLAGKTVETAQARAKKKSESDEERWSTVTEDYPDRGSNPGNHVNDSFQKVKKILLSEVYRDHPVTLYCGYPFNPKDKQIELPKSFSAPVHGERSSSVEWEHVVPAEHFGQSFREWKEGSNLCINNNGTHYKGRRCAEEANSEYRFIQADMYNLFPAVGSVNAVRSNYPYAMLPEVPNTFGSCEMKVENGMAEPPERARGRIARAMLYMELTYPTHYRMGEKTRRMIEDWNSRYPVDAWECLRATRIERIQKNRNPFVVEACKKAGIGYPVTK